MEAEAEVEAEVEKEMERQIEGSQGDRKGCMTERTGLGRETDGYTKQTNWGGSTLCYGSYNVQRSLVFFIC